MGQTCVILDSECSGHITSSPSMTSSPPNPVAIQTTPPGLNSEFQVTPVAIQTQWAFSNPLFADSTYDPTLSTRLDFTLHEISESVSARATSTPGVDQDGDKVVNKDATVERRQQKPIEEVGRNDV